MVYDHDGRGKQQTLAGGAICYGRLCDLLGAPANYMSEHLIARFSVVQRSAWQLVFDYAEEVKDAK
jgi:hypothetical protein